MFIVLGEPLTQTEPRVEDQKSLNRPMNKLKSLALFICPRRTRAQTRIVIHLKIENYRNKTIKKMFSCAFTATFGHLCLRLLLN
jgi:hypothetical protein